MICIDSRDFRFDQRTIVTIGKFDGIHIGHQKLINRAKEIAAGENLPVVAFTFRVVEGKSYPYMESSQITSFKEREKVFEKFGVDYLIEYPFDDEIANMEPLEFLEQLVKNKLNARYVVVGCDWTYGKMGLGNVELLQASQKLYDFTAEIMEKELYNGREVGSTWIREEITAGNMETANILLGYPFFFSGEVVYGNQIGRTIGIPTVNIIPSLQKTLPPYGVYAAKINIDNKEFYGVTNVGVKPTVTDDMQVSVETNIINYNDDAYGKIIDVQLIHFLRPEMKFQNVEALKTQLERDIDFTKSYFMI